MRLRASQPNEIVVSPVVPLYPAATVDLGTVKGFFTEVDVYKNQLIFTWEIGKSETFLGTSDSDTSKLECMNTLLRRGSPIWYINQSCNANAGLRGCVSIIAMRDIKVGEEVVVDYSLNTSETASYMICNCGEKNCRTLICSMRTRLPSYRKRASLLNSSSRAQEVSIPAPTSHYFVLATNVFHPFFFNSLH
jgi:SET domain